MEKTGSLSHFNSSEIRENFLYVGANDIPSLSHY